MVMYLGQNRKPEYYSLDEIGKEDGQSEVTIVRRCKAGLGHTEICEDCQDCQYLLSNTGESGAQPCRML